MSNGAKFVRGDIDDTTGRLTLERENDSTGECPDLVLMRGTLTDNGDSTYDLTFDGS